MRTLPKSLYKTATLRPQIETFTTLLIITMVGVGGFIFGRLSVLDTEASVIEIVYEEDVSDVVASKSGTRYHLPWCSGAKRIQEENRITFSSPEEAQLAGYTPALNCKGLK